MRNSSKLLAATLALGASVLGASAANASPISLFYSLDGVTFTQLGATTTTGTNSFTGTVGTFGVQLSATGTGTSPFSLPAPGFDTNTITVSSSAGGTIYLASIETGLTSNVASFNLGFTNNANSTTSVIESFYAATNLTFSTAALSKVTVAPNGATPLTVASPSFAGAYQIGEMYQINFGAAGGNVNATISERGVVPEPVSISLLGAGLAGLGVIRLRRKA